MSQPDGNSIVIGLTGGIACGKSEVGTILERMGFSVCDADRVAHELMTVGQPVYQQVVDYFGKYILTEQGEISRPALAAIVFENPEQREVLNRIVHPVIKKYLLERITQYRSDGKNAAVLIPLLYESGMQDLGWDSVVCVSSNQDAVFQRLENRGLNKVEAKQRIGSQMPLAEKESLADYVVSNTGTLVELKLAVHNVVKAIAGGR